MTQHLQHGDVTIPFVLHLEVRDVLDHRVVQVDPSLFHQLHQRRSDEQLRNRCRGVEGIGGHALAGIDIGDAVPLGKDDLLISTIMTDGKNEILLASKEGKAIRFKEKDIRDMGRGAKGVRGIKLGKKDALIGMERVSPDGSLLTITENGFGKRTSFEEYRLQSRGGKGIINVKITAKNGNVIGLKSVKDKIEGSFFIEDAGFFVDQPLNGFPGVYSSYVMNTIGNEGILNLIHDFGSSKAHFSAVIALYYKPLNKIITFEGEVKGRVSETIRGAHGFGFDPIFIPEMLPNSTFAELSMSEKNEVSHRSIALNKLINFLKENPVKE